MRARAFIRDSSGFTLIEVMVAIVVLSIGVLGTISLVDNGNRRTSDTRGREGATSLVRELVESSRTVPFNNLTQADLQASLEWRPSLADADPAPGWQIKRRNFTYTVSYTICTVDDVSDGYGTSASHDSSFCSGTPSAPSSQGADRNPVDFRRVVFRADWSDTRGAQSAQESALINSTYRGPFPTAITSVPTSPVLDNAVSSVQFTATTNANAANVKWFLNGRLQGDATGSATTWNWTWDLGPACSAGAVPDGTYFLSAAAYDRNGATGGPKASSIDINRCPPSAPTGVQGGRNWGMLGIEVTWAANPESDVIGYQVLRGTTVVCPLTTKLSCRDNDPADLAATSPIDLTVVAYDQGPSGQRAGAASAPLTVLPDCGSNPCNNPPNTPNVSINGATLTISTPNPQDKDAGDGVDFYRIYRTTGTTPPTGPSDRYDTVDNSGGAVTWTDPSPGSYHYWVTAVDRHYTESQFSAVVP